jgi:arylsulfatase A-like enzyme
MIDLAGATPLPDAVGRSLVALLDGEDTEWENETFSEHCPSYGVPPARMIRRDDWKLVHYEGYRPQLFNLKEDPDEFRDLGDDPVYEDIRNDLTRRVLANWSGAHMLETLERRERTNSLLAEWFKSVRPECPEQWVAPPEVNVFPDDSDPPQHR